ncbi:PhnD/SsuA/transferrin family substrate-binding protein [Lutibacter sp.]|uniref:PhnD/SsuA/transferrin family substrate-binding protein n=1 Tax=Lutibacter sp. TaxID=1925666 RepID=UPI002736D683|nr:PhnD/SsuA/transferrin family substrate-binding protein [Lutibacter sp.]MDP3312948.1 PhnD/SsuA/transferrin family substrate-binding protein [Lutibacter sp.]
MFIIIGTFLSCKQEPKYQGPIFSDSPTSQTLPVYHFAIHPLHNPAKLIQEYKPLMDYLNERIEGVKFTVEASRDYANFEEKYTNRKSEFILPNPWQTLQAINVGYNVIAMAGEPEDFKGIFIVRKDSNINEPIDLKGSAVSYPSPTALAACIMPQYFLYTHGININNDIENKYVGSQMSSIMNVYLKNTSAGATWPPPWRAFQKEYPKEASELKVLWETESLINNSVMVRDDVPNHIKEKVIQSLINLHKTKQGKEILEGMETAKFFLATNKNYDLVKNYIHTFELEVRKIELK